MSPRNAFLLLSVWLIPSTVVAQHAQVDDGMVFTNVAYLSEGNEFLRKGLHAFRGRGPYMILFQQPEHPVVNPIFTKALVTDAKILFVLPQNLTCTIQKPQNRTKTTRQDTGIKLIHAKLH